MEIRILSIPKFFMNNSNAMQNMVLKKPVTVKINCQSFKKPKSECKQLYSFFYA